MKEITRIHLAKVAYDIEVDAKKDIESYLSQLGVYADDAEVMTDIEIRMTELLAERGVKAGGVIGKEDVAAVRARLGEPTDFVEEGVEIQPQEEKNSKQLYRDEDSAWLGGVLAGLAKYFGIDPIWARLIFIGLLFVSFGTASLIYIVLWILISPARTAAEKLRMQGKPVTLEAMKSLGDRAAPAVNNTARILKTLLVICVGTGLIIAAIGALAIVAAVLTGVAFDWGGVRGSIDGSPWYLAALGLASASGLLFAALCIVLAVALFRRTWSTAMTVATVAITVLGLTSFGASAAAVAFGSDQQYQEVKSSMVKEDVTLPAEFAQVKSIKFQSVDRHIASGNVEYIVSSDKPHYTLNAVEGDKLDVAINGDQATLKYNGSKDSMTVRNGQDVTLRIYGPALDTLQTTSDSYDITYKGKKQDSLTVNAQDGQIKLEGEYQAMQIEARGAADVDAEWATVSMLSVKQSDNSDVQAGVVKELTVEHPEACSASEWGGNSADLEVSAVTNSVMTYNGAERPVQSIENLCGEVSIDSDEDDK